MACPDYKGKIASIQLRMVGGDKLEATAESNPAAIKVLESWKFTKGYESWWSSVEDAPPTARPIGRLDVRVSEDRMDPNNWIVQIFGADDDPKKVFPAFWTFRRMFDEGNSHPLCWHALTRAQLDKLIETLEKGN